MRKLDLEILLTI